MVIAKTILLVVPAVAGALTLHAHQTASYTSSAQMVGWYSATVDQSGASGTQVYTPGGTALPAGLTIALTNDHTLSTITGAAAQMNCDGTGTPNGVISANVVGKAVITTSQPFSQGLPWSVQLTYRGTALANTTAYNVASTAKASSFTFLGRISDRSIDTTPPHMDKVVGPVDKVYDIPLKGLSWSGASGSKTSAFAVNTFPQGGQDYATPGVRAGDNYASGAQSGSGVSVKITGCTASNTGTIMMSVPEGSPVALVNIYDGTGSPVANWMVGADDSNQGFMHIGQYAAGSYTLLIHVPGTLLSKVTAQFDPNGSTTVSPTWRWGDLDGDNAVSQSEINFIQYHLGANANAMDSMFPDYTGPYSSYDYTIHDADFDHDGTITQTDLNLATPNVGVYGDSL